MRWWFALAVIALGEVGCGAGASAPADATGDDPVDAAPDASVDATPDATAWPALLFDVRAAPTYLFLTASDPARTACTRYEFLREGCEEVSDVIRCGADSLAPWITSASVTSGGTVLATVSPVDVWVGVSFGASVLAGHDDLAIVLTARDGQRAEIPIPTGVVPPRPTVTSATYDGAALHVAWTATPSAASTVVEIIGGFMGYRCHVAAPQQAIDVPWLAPPDGSTYHVVTYAPATAIPTPLGEAMVWFGERVEAPLPQP